jgi:pimeloyl-ACP methyl ester carboxylesterase
MKVLVDGLMTTYQRVGSGPTILLLHGWGDSMDTYSALVRDFQESYTLLAVDLPGFGGTETPKVTFNLELYAKFVASFLLKIGDPELFAVIGHSNGGAIAIKALSSKILKSKKLVLLASSGVRNSYSPSNKLKRMIFKLLKIPAMLLPSSMQKKIKKKVYEKIGSDLFVAEQLQDTFKQIITEDVTDDATKISQQTLLLYGTNDKATPVSYGRLFNEKISGSELVVIQGAEHFLHHTNSKEVLVLIRSFLARS